MKLTIQPVRKMRKGRSFVWRDCTVDGAHAFEIRHKGVMKRRVPTLAEAERLVYVFNPPKAPVNRDSMIGRRWNDVKDKL